MNITYFEGSYGLEIDMKPESVKELAALMRTVKNTKAIKAEIRLFFEGDEPTMSIWIKKIQPKAQTNSIHNP